MQPQAQPTQTREQFIKSLFVLENTDNFLTGKEAVKKQIDGIDKGVNVIKLSYGPTGSNSAIKTYEYPYHRVTNDGKTIIDAIKLADPFETIGLDFVKEVADKSDKESGAGRKTTMLLLQAILKEGFKYDEFPMDIKRSLDECLEFILTEIDKNTKKITAKEVAKIATIASESPKLGAIFQEIYEKIGKNGIVELDNSGISDTFYDITEGVRLLNCKFMYPYMANEDKGRQAVYKFPKILIVKQKLSNISELDSILQQVSDKGTNELVIFCDDIDLNVSQALAFLHNGITPDGKQITPFKTLVIKAPVLWKDWLFEDFAKITKATIVDPAQGKTLKNFQYAWLGYCDKVITSKDETVVLGTQDISEHLQNLKDINTDDAKIRIARLQTKTAILKLGANSESELSYIRGKALDARNESYLALNGGVVRGAGQELHAISKILPKTIGGKILAEAISYPYEQIMKNDPSLKNADLKDIWDSATVVKNAITNALSVASTILTNNSLIDLSK